MRFFSLFVLLAPALASSNERNESAPPRAVEPAELTWHVNAIETNKAQIIANALERQGVETPDAPKLAPLVATVGPDGKVVVTHAPAPEPTTGESPQ